MTSCVHLAFFILGIGLLCACQADSEQSASAQTPPTDSSAVQEEVAEEQAPVRITRRPNVSQQFVGISPAEIRLAYALPEIPYRSDNLPENARMVNQAIWQDGIEINEAVAIKIQALLNYHHHKVGAVTGEINANTIKAMQVYQEKLGLPLSDTMNAATWQALSADESLMAVPVLIHYTLTSADVEIPYHPKGQQYRSVKEAVAEKFHMSQALLDKLNPDTPLKAGNSIVVYNPYQPNIQDVHRVVANKEKNILYAYNEQDELVASYPTTVGSSYKPSPSGTHKVINRVLDPYYNKDFSNKNSVLPPGPNNPVGRVWIGISRPTYGIHGSPEPEKISQQKSSGCVRLTNWDALALFGTIQEGATVEFL